MKRSWNFVVVFLLIATIIFSTQGSGWADAAAEKETDVAQMKKVWEALMAFKKAKGVLPDKLSELVPGYLPDPKVLVSPKDDGGQQNGPITNKEEKHPSSYCYEWGPQQMGTSTFKEVKTIQLEEYGPVVPLLRCFLYEKVLNVSHSGEFYESETYWETSPALKALLAKHGLGPGCSTGKFLEITTEDPAGKALAGVRVTAAARQIQGLPLPDRTLTTNAEGKVRMPFGPDPVRNAILSFSADRHFAMPVVSPEAGFAETLLVKMSLARRASGVIRDTMGRPVVGAQIRFSKVLVENAGDGGAQPNAALAQRQAVPLQMAIIDGVLRQRNDPNQIASVETGPSGEWKLDSLPKGEDWKIEVAVSHPNYRLAKAVVGDPLFTADNLLGGKGDIVLREPIRIAGQLRDAVGAPIAKATVFLKTPVDPLERRAMPQLPETKTDEEGRFEFQTRVTGESALVALPKNQTPILHAFVLKDDPEPLMISPPAGRKITGVVRDTSRKPVANVPILFTGWTTLTLSEQPVVATSDEAGNWTWDNAPAELVRGYALLPSGRLWFWSEQMNKPVEIKIPLIERE